jgi:hypothetical protein
MLCGVAAVGAFALLSSQSRDCRQHASLLSLLEGVLDTVGDLDKDASERLRASVKNLMSASEELREEARPRHLARVLSARRETLTALRALESAAGRRAPVRLDLASEDLQALRTALDNAAANAQQDLSLGLGA